MTSAAQFANMLLVTHSYPELRAAGLDEFSALVQHIVEASGLRLIAFSDESSVLDAPCADNDRNLTTFDSVEELSRHLLESTDREMQGLLECLMADPGSDEFDDDPTGPDEEEDDDSPEFA